MTATMATHARSVVVERVLSSPHGLKRSVSNSQLQIGDAIKYQVCPVVLSIFGLAAVSLSMACTTSHGASEMYVPLAINVQDAQGRTRIRLAAETPEGPAVSIMESDGQIRCQVTPTRVSMLGSSGQTCFEVDTDFTLIDPRFVRFLDAIVGSGRDQSIEPFQLKNPGVVQLTLGDGTTSSVILAAVHREAVELLIGHGSTMAVSLCISDGGLVVKGLNGEVLFSAAKN
ncbi:MAG: hypothetical protein IT459_04845 [Planctomycetes bacterium]|nr:hypothetical protein [Planctomycetota bacterium]